ncbi:SSI family serine proteinase inhibitor [Streptomyces sp. 43Y-GA-1]|uniref:SSI family serine proteinase inhibitor n=1 Tax=Streptomyces sp. 43Y-GA-1 TaxID=2939435 RepID=UPI0020C08658|nr:SSI family serine proteinase inhibitor [Streptomyces sp. 43Y-GA-1]MCL6292621.1 subtilase-type protease inhibitor [Streptomyces sp. 43Y-GA-1]
MLRRLALTAVVSLAALATAVPASIATASGPASSGPVPSAVPTTGPFAAARPALGPLPMPLPLPGFLDGGDSGKGSEGGEAGDVRTRLTVSVENTGVAGADGTFELECGPTGGSHPQGQAACDRLAEAGATRSGRQELFRETPEGTMCTMIHGGDAAARIVGTWEGRAVDTTASRRDGCEIARWNSLVPVLPDVR